MLLGIFWVHKPVIKIQCLNWFSKRLVVAWDGQFLTVLRWVHLKAFPNPTQQPGHSVVFQPNRQLFSTSQVVTLESFPLYFSKEYFSYAHLEIVSQHSVFQIWDFTQESSVHGIPWILWDCSWARTLAFTEHPDIRIRYHFLWDIFVCLLACLLVFSHSL